MAARGCRSWEREPPAGSRWEPGAAWLWAPSWPPPNAALPTASQTQGGGTETGWPGAPVTTQPPRLYFVCRAALPAWLLSLALTLVFKHGTETLGPPKNSRDPHSRAHTHTHAHTHADLLP